MIPRSPPPSLAARQRAALEHVALRPCLPLLPAPWAAPPPAASSPAALLPNQTPFALPQAPLLRAPPLLARSWAVPLRVALLVAQPQAALALAALSPVALQLAWRWSASLTAGPLQCCAVELLQPQGRPGSQHGAEFACIDTTCDFLAAPPSQEQTAARMDRNALPLACARSTQRMDPAWYIHGTPAGHQPATGGAVYTIQFALVRFTVEEPRTCVSERLSPACCILPASRRCDLPSASMTPNAQRSRSCITAVAAAGVLLTVLVVSIGLHKPSQAVVLAGEDRPRDDDPNLKPHLSDTVWQNASRSPQLEPSTRLTQVPSGMRRHLAGCAASAARHAAWSLSPTSPASGSCGGGTRWRSCSTGPATRC